MGRIVVSENASVDGVVQDPTGEEDFARGGWFGQVTDNDRDAWASAALAEALDARALLLGRRSYEFFAARWPARSGPFADRLNTMPKYVVSSTLADPGWHNSSVLTGDVPGSVARLKQEIDGDIVVYASFQLADVLIEHGLVDEVRLTLYPFVVGGGRRFPSETSAKVPLRLISSKIIGSQLAFLAYEIDGG